MTILITGATGFIGGALARRLLSEGAPVRILARDPGRAALLAKDGAEIIRGDVTDIASCNKAAIGADAVIHSAGVLGGWGKPESLFWKVNYEGTKNMLEAASGANVKRFVHVSSCGVFGPLNGGETPADERPYNPSNTYEKTKAEAEKIALEFSRNGLPLVVVRPEFVYGPGDLHLLGLFRAIKRGRFLFFNDGAAMVHPTYIDDLVDGILLALKSDKSIGRGFNIAGEKRIMIKDFADSISIAMSVPPTRFSIPSRAASIIATILENTAGRITEPPLTKAQVEFLTKDHGSSIMESKKVLGYQPKIGIDEGIRRTVDWYRSQDLL